MFDWSRIQQAAALMLLWLGAPFLVANAQQSDDLGDGYLGPAVCSGCHLQTAAHWSHTVHARIFLHIPENDREARGCEACHGPGADHRLNPLDKSTIIRFTKGSATQINEQNDVCLTCHKGGQRMHWLGSAHENQELACSDCHNPMANFSAAGLLANMTVNETCFGCHNEQRSQFQRRSHMPLPEGKMSCIDCHNPHGTVTDPLLIADSVNETCFQCHAEKRGPFLFEHAPVRDSCLNCHSPHGSNHDKLLVTAAPILCQQCHTSIGHMNELFTRRNIPSGSAPDVRVIGRSCVNCHVQIHGSNHPAGSKLHR